MRRERERLCTIVRFKVESRDPAPPLLSKRSQKAAIWTLRAWRVELLKQEEERGGMAETLDPVTALTYALSCSTDSPEQATALKALRAVFEAQPAAIPQFCATLLGNAVAGKDSLFKRFTIELFGYALGTNSLSLDVRTQRESFCYPMTLFH